MIFFRVILSLAKMEMELLGYFILFLIAGFIKVYLKSCAVKLLTDFFWIARRPSRKEWQLDFLVPISWIVHVILLFVRI
jgi:hypothetical protein